MPGETLEDLKGFAGYKLELFYNKEMGQWIIHNSGDGGAEKQFLGLFCTAECHNVLGELLIGIIAYLNLPMEEQKKIEEKSKAMEDQL